MTLAIQIESSLSGYMKNDGTVNSNGTIEFFVDDSYSTYKDIYSDANASTILSQPIALNNAGLPVDGIGNPIVLFANGVYWARLKDSIGNIINTYQSLSYSSQVDFGGIFIDIANKYGRTNSDIDNAISDYTGNGDVTFVFNGGQFICSNTKTFPSNIKLVFINGAYLNNSGTITFNGQVNLEQNSYILNSGTITFNSALITEQAVYITNNGTLAFKSQLTLGKTSYITNGGVLDIYGQVNLDYGAYFNNTAITANFNLHSIFLVAYDTIANIFQGNTYTGSYSNAQSIVFPSGQILTPATIITDPIISNAPLKIFYSLDIVNNNLSSGSVIFLTAKNSGNTTKSVNILFDANSQTLFFAQDVGTTAQINSLIPFKATSLSAGGLSGKYLGSYFVEGSNAGNNAEQGRVTIPSGAKIAIVYVYGDYLNSVANTNDGFLMGVWRESANRITTLHDINDSGGGSNQGFVLNYSSGDLVVNNKGGMTYNQSGNCTFIFWGS